MKRPKKMRSTNTADIVEAYTIGWATITTLAYRLPMLWLSAVAPTASRRREESRMVSEKIAAAQEGVLAGQMALVKALWSPAATLSSPFAAWSDMARAASAPARRTVKANARRLSRRKRL